MKASTLKNKSDGDCSGIKSVRCETVEDDEIIDQVMELKYLGLLITSSGQLKKEINVQI